MLYKYISSKAIIQQVMSRFKITDSSLIFDALEWIGSAIGLIGTHANYINKVDSVEVDFFKIPYPCDLYQLNYIVYNGRKLKYGIKKNIFSSKGSVSDDPMVVDLIQSIFVRGELCERLCDTDCCDPLVLEDLNTKKDFLDNRIKSLAKFVDKVDCYHEDEWFSTNESTNCYDTSIESGTVVISYKAYPVDDEGYPLIIDEVKYKLALEWYVVRCLVEGGYKHPTLGYEIIDAKTRQAIAQATNEHLKMTTQEADNFTSNWTNMLFQLRSNNMNYYSN